MPVITISRGSYSRGKHVAEAVADKLGIRCISRDVLLDASGQFNVPEIKLRRAIHDAPSILDRFRHGRQIYIAYIRSALARRAAAEDLVYHGLAGHLLLAGVPHVLRIRIIADMEPRILEEMQREQISETEARELLKRDDDERRRWTKSLYHVDPWDSSLYDLVIHVHQLSIGDAVDLICEAATKKPFVSNPSRKQKLQDFALACQMKAAIVDPFFDARVTSSYGNVVVYAHSAEAASQLKKRARELQRELKGIQDLEIHDGGVDVPEEAV